MSASGTPNPAPTTDGEFRERITDRRPITDHDGASGARLEWGRLDDGSALVLKTFDQQRDLTMRIAGRTLPLDVELWQAGVLDRLPETLSHAMVGVWQESGAWVLAMRDVSDTLLSYESRLSRESCRQLLRAATDMHEAFWGEQVSGAWPLTQRLNLFAPSVMASLRDSENPLPAWVLQGWADFDRLAPEDVRILVRTVHDRPETLAQPLLELGGRTLLHGDYWTPNLAPGPDDVVAIDWALATVGPPVVEFSSFLVGCANQVDATREQILDDVREIGADRHNEQALTLGLAFGVVEMGWNLAWHAARTPGGSAQDDFDWWIEAARRAAATGLLP